MKAKRDKENLTDPKQEGTEELGKWRKRMLNALLHESDSEETEEATLQDILRKVDGAWLLRQMPLITLILFFCIVTTTLHYQWQQQLIEREELEKELDDLTYRTAAMGGELTVKTRESMIEQQLRMNGDSTLLPSVDEPFVVEVEQAEE